MATQPRDFDSEIRALMAQRETARAAQVKQASEAPRKPGLNFALAQRQALATPGMDEARINARIKQTRDEWRQREEADYERDARAARARLAAVLSRQIRLAAELSVASGGFGELTNELEWRRNAIMGRHGSRLPQLCPATDAGQRVAEDLLRQLKQLEAELKD